MESLAKSPSVRRIDLLGAATDFRVGNLGHIESPRGVRFAATHSLHDGKSENHLVTDPDTALFRYSMRMPRDVAVSVAGRPLRSCGPLGYCGPGVTVDVCGKGRYTTVWCMLGSAFLRSLAMTETGLQLKDVDLLHSIDSERLLQHGRAAFREAIEPGFCNSVFAEATAIAVVVEIARYYGSRRLDREHRGGLAPWQMRRLDDYIREHLSEDLSLHDLAMLLGISVRHLSRVVRQEKGVSLHRWIADYRLSEARRLLSETDLPIQEVARRSAFRSLAAFSTAFRAASGFAPSEYRRLNA
ncbi:MAG: AraC family transcriptional regulator [Steroidobacteraceae bacterium]